MIGFMVHMDMAWWEEDPDLKGHPTHFLVFDVHLELLMTQRISLTRNTPKNWELAT